MTTIQQNSVATLAHLSRPSGLDSPSGYIRPDQATSISNLGRSAIHLHGVPQPGKIYVSSDQKGKMLIKAAEKGDLDKVKSLVLLGGILNDHLIEAAMYAADRDHPKIVQYLHNYSKIDHGDTHIFLLLRAAPYFKDPEALRTFLKGATPDHRGQILSDALRIGNFDIVPVILEGEKISEYYLKESVSTAIEKREPVIVQTILKQYSPGAYDRGQFLVQETRDHGNAEMIKIILESGPTRSFERGTAVRLLAEKGNYLDMKTVLSHGDIIPHDFEGALQTAAAKGYRKILAELLSVEGVEEGDRGRALISAAHNTQLILARMILRTGNADKKSLQKAIEIASEKGNSGMVRLIREESGTSVNRAKATWFALKTGNLESLSSLFTRTVTREVELWKPRYR